MKVEPLVVVEGLHDKQAVERAVEADVWVLGGDKISHRTVQELRRAALVRGVLILTDPDGPGERIRRRLAALIPEALHAFVPKAAAKANGRIGIEAASPDAILQAIEVALERTSRATSAAVKGRTFALADLAMHGLVGTPMAAARREFVGDLLGIGRANAKAFLWKLNALCIRDDEWQEAIHRLNEESLT